jgi:clan AA aspartic protease (TIGR02281 family)
MTSARIITPVVLFFLAVQRLYAQDILFPGNTGDVDAKNRLNLFVQVGKSAGIPITYLMAICERPNPSGLAEDAKCALDWATYLAQKRKLNSDWEKLLQDEFGFEKAAALRDRALEIGFENWPDLMAKKIAKKAAPSDTTFIAAGADGHFRLSPELDGVPIEMMVDTGASQLVLSYSDAIRIGIDLETIAYNTPFQTASGVENFAPVMIRNLSLAGLSLQNIVAFVAKDAATLETSLLGMSVLGEFSTLEFSGNTLKIEP